MPFFKRYAQRIFLLRITYKISYKDLMIEFLNMGGHAIFVWSSYAIALGLTSILFYKTTKEYSKLETSLEKKTSRQKEVQPLPQEI